MTQPTEFRPRLACDVKRDGDALVLARGDLEVALEPDASSIDELRGFLARLDGARTLGEIAGGLPEDERARLVQVVEDLDRTGLLDDARTVKGRSGKAALLEIEALVADLMDRTINRNVFWDRLLGPVGGCPTNVFYGLAIENYQFLLREALFDAPVLPYVANQKARVLMNEFFCSELGHDEIVLRALKAIGITREEMEDSIPLPETLAMCNALSYWAATDPLFFFMTLGILEGKDVEVDPFVAACEANGLPKAFVTPMRHHSDINRKAEHGNLTRLIFAEIPIVDDRTMARMRRQTRLFMEMYDDWYTAIWRHYSTADVLVRRISSFEKGGRP